MVNAFLIYKEIYPWKTTQIKLFIVLCEYEIAMLIMSVVKTLKLHLQDYIWIVSYSDIWYHDLEVPQNTFSLRVNPYLYTRYVYFFDFTNRQLILTFHIFAPAGLPKW